MSYQDIHQIVPILPQKLLVIILLGRGIIHMAYQL